MDDNDTLGPLPTSIQRSNGHRRQSTIAFNPYEETAKAIAAENAPKFEPNRPQHAQDAPVDTSISQGDVLLIQKDEVHEHHEGQQGAVGMHHPKLLGRIRLRLWLATCLAFVILAPLISIIMGVTLHAKEMRYPGGEGLNVFSGRTVRCPLWIWSGG